MPIGPVEGNGGSKGGAVRASAERLAPALLLDPTTPDPGAGCWADARPLGLTCAPILLGWRRSGGPLLVGTSDGEASPGLLAETLSLAESTVGWTTARWDEAFRSFWQDADRSLRDALAARLPLPGSEPWSLATWSEVVWGTWEPEGETAIALVGGSLDDGVTAALEWLGRRTRGAAGFTAHAIDRGGRRVRCMLVAGRLDAAPERPLPGEIREPVAEAPPDPLESVERLAREAGASATWSRRDWVRLVGPGGAIRAFPRADGVWLQLIGADEGTLAGLRFRHGVPLAERPAPDAPPGAHFRLRSEADVTPGVAAVIRSWLRGG